MKITLIFVNNLFVDDNITSMEHVGEGNHKDITNREPFTDLVEENTVTESRKQRRKPKVIIFHFRMYAFSVKFLLGLNFNSHANQLR